MGKKAERRIAKLETKQATLAAPDAALMAIFGITNISSVAVSPEEALAVPAVNCAIRVLSDAAAGLSRNVVVKQDDGYFKRQPDHPVGELLNGDANDWTSTTEMIRDLVAQSLTQDAGGIVWCNRVDGRVVEMINYRNGVVQVDTEDTGEPTFKINDRVLDAADVLHLRTPFDRCPLQMARESIGIARVMEKLAASFFANGTRPSGVIKFPKGLGDEGLKKMKAAWKAAHAGTENAGKTPILWDGADFVPYTFSSVDSQFTELRTFQILEIARAFRVPPQMLFELGRATWSNGEQAGREFLVYSLNPILLGLEAILTRVLFTKEERKTHRIMFDRDDLTQASLTERAQAINSLRASKVINANEGRDWIGMSPYVGGELYENTNITTPSIVPPTGPVLRRAA